MANTIGDHLKQAKKHMTEAQALALEKRLEREIAVRQEQLRRLKHLRQLAKKHPRE